LRERNYYKWQIIPWPKGVTVSEESFFPCCIYYEVVTMLKVPEEDFKDNYICGKPSPALVEEILGRWRI
jgi:hypothetical protein